MESIEEHLSSSGVKPTAVRILVWKEICKQNSTFALNDIESAMPTMDRSSIFRALRLFTQHHLLHEINDGSGFQKYCVCHCENELHTSHIHFSCTKCGKTFCLEDYHIPAVQLPSNYLVEETEYIMKGICPSCQGANSIHLH